MKDVYLFIYLSCFRWWPRPRASTETWFRPLRVCPPPKVPLPWTKTCCCWKRHLWPPWPASVTACIFCSSNKSLGRSFLSVVSVLCIFYLCWTLWFSSLMQAVSLHMLTHILYIISLPRNALLVCMPSTNCQKKTFYWKDIRQKMNLIFN